MTSPRPSSSLPFAVIGAGAVAVEHHLPALRRSDRAHAQALVDLDLERARTTASRFGVPRVAERIEEVADGVVAAIVALPNHLHAPVSRALLERGIHVLVEKPMALDGAQCDAMIDAGRSSGAKLAVGLEFRYLPGFRAVADLVCAGALGRIEGVDVRQGVDLQWPLASDYLFRKERAGGGVLMDFGSHLLDLLLWWLGDLELVAYRDDARGGVEANCEVELRTPEGAPVRVETSRTRTLRNTCRIRGENEVLEVDVWTWKPRIRRAATGSACWTDGQGMAPSASVADLGDAFVAQLDDFVDAVATGGSPRVPGEEGARHIRLIEACYASRRPLRFPWSDEQPPGDRS